MVLLWEFGFHLNWMRISDVKIEFLGHINASATQQAASALVNLGIVLVMNIWTSFKNPHQLVTIKSMAEMSEISEEEATFLKSLEETELNYYKRKQKSIFEVLQSIFTKEERE